MEADRILRERILEMVPQRHPFRFIEEILELDEEHIVGVYRFRSDEYFYRGHFPGLPVTPGVILIETMAQTGVVAFGLYLSCSGGRGRNRSRIPSRCSRWRKRWSSPAWSAPASSSGLRDGRFISAETSSRSTASMTRPDGEEVCSGILAGKGVPREKFMEQKERGPAPIIAGRVKEETGS